MKKLFISQPMNGLTDEEILTERISIKARAEKEIGEPVELIDSYFSEYPDSNIKNKGVWYLGKSLMKMAEADIVYFGKHWECARGCILEHMTAEAYELTIMEDKKHGTDN